MQLEISAYSNGTIEATMRPPYGQGIVALIWDRRAINLEDCIETNLPHAHVEIKSVTVSERTPRE